MKSLEMQGQWSVGRAQLNHGSSHEQFQISVSNLSTQLELDSAYRKKRPSVDNGSVRGDASTTSSAASLR